MTKSEVIEKIKEIGVLPVIRANSADEDRQIIEAIRQGGITTIEITMTVPNAVDLIADLSKTDSDILIGAGTVLDVETARKCVAAGAKFIISPALNLETIKFCNAQNIVVMPGALTPTEVVTAWQAGADFVKVFPASAVGGASYLKSLKAPLPHIKLIPTGGVSLKTAADFFRVGAEAVGVGADLVDLQALREGRHDSISETARQYVEIAKAERRLT
ncbi:MAG: bifunctional 4-hydroxy-2-oxoglutarate aldolase/2-dehydro-3-deoxy-phosphogluconate aldolase [Acidobacteriota bacterium]|nr:bifunctional 4-hydroxy-2-oxoglutarate aldolase/2-dehydro-3-deoxy-phosphogluconate aldolase [Acidobacteriota bacterium]